MSKRTSLLAFLLLLASPAFAQNGHYANIILDGQGHPIAGATVLVCTEPATGTPCTPVATLYTSSSGGTTSANPFFTDGLGNYDFYAVPGSYQVQISGPQIQGTRIYDYVTVASPTGGSSCPNGAAGCANQALSNLTSPTAVDQNLLPSSDESNDVGSTFQRWGGGYFSILVSGSIDFELTPPTLLGNLAMDSNGLYQSVSGHSGLNGHFTVLNEFSGGTPVCANGSFFLGNPVFSNPTGFLQYCGNDNAYHYAGLTAPSLNAFASTVIASATVTAGQFLVFSGFNGTNLQPTYAPAPAGTTSGVVGVALTSGVTSGGFLMVPVGNVPALIDNSCTTNESIVPSATTTGDGHCTTSPGSLQVLGYEAGNQGGSGVPVNIWATMGGIGLTPAPTGVLQFTNHNLTANVSCLATTVCTVDSVTLAALPAGCGTSGCRIKVSYSYSIFGGTFGQLWVSDGTNTGGIGYFDTNTNFSGASAVYTSIGQFSSGATPTITILGNDGGSYTVCASMGTGGGTCGTAPANTPAITGRFQVEVFTSAN